MEISIQSDEIPYKKDFYIGKFHIACFEKCLRSFIPESARNLSSTDAFLALKDRPKEVQWNDIAGFVHGT